MRPPGALWCLVLLGGCADPCESPAPIDRCRADSTAPDCAMGVEVVVDPAAIAEIPPGPTVECTGLGFVSGRDVCNASVVHDEVGASASGGLAVTLDPGYPVGGRRITIEAMIDERGRAGARVCSAPHTDTRGACLPRECATAGTLVLDRALDSGPLRETRGSVDVTLESGATIRATFGG